MAAEIDADPRTAGAEVVDRMAASREEKDDQLLSAVVEAMEGRSQLNLLEADLAYDSALRRLMQWAGLPVPPLLEPTLPNWTAP